MAAVVKQRLAGATHAVEAAQQVVAHTATGRVSKEYLLIRSFRDHYTANARRALAPHTDSLHRIHETLLRDTGRALRGELGTILEVRTDVANVARQQARQVGQSLAQTTHGLTTLAQRKLDILAENQADVMAGVGALADREIHQHSKLLRHLSDLVQAYDPVHVLRRGFSITLNAQGKAVKAAADLAPGETIITRLAAGQITSTITLTT